MATLQPAPSSPRRFSTATSTLSKKISAKPGRPSSCGIGRTVIPGLRQRHENKGETVMPLRLRIGAEHTETPVRPDRTGRPGLLAVDDVLVAFQPRGGADRRHVGTGIGLGPALRPDFLAGGHLRQDARFLLIGAVFHQRGAEQEDAVLVDPQRRARLVVLLLEDQPLDQVAAATAQLLGPGDHAPAPFVERGFPLRGAGQSPRRYRRTAAARRARWPPASRALPRGRPFVDWYTLSPSLFL